MPTINNPYVNPVDLNNTAPKVHASQHRKGGSDPLTPADIGAAAENHTHDVSGLTVAWNDVTNKPTTFFAAPHAATHGSGGGDPLAIDASQIATGTVPLARLPHGCLERLVIVQNDAARFALTTADVQQGDTVKVVETSTMYFVVDDTKLDSPDGYVAYTAGAASAVDWSAITGKPDTFAPSQHVHDVADISAAVDARLSELGISQARMLPAGFSKQETTVNFPANSVSFTQNDTSVSLNLGDVNAYSRGISFQISMYINGLSSVNTILKSGNATVWNGGNLGGYNGKNYTVSISKGVFLSDLRFELTGMSTSGGLSFDALAFPVVRLVA